MKNHGGELAVQFERVHGNVVSAVSELNEADLARFCVAEQCTVAALACHIAQVCDANEHWVQEIVAGKSLPDLTMSDIDRINAEQAILNADLSKDEVLARLQYGGERMLAVLQALHDNDLERTAPFSLAGGAPISIQWLIENGLLGHLEQHLASLRATVAGGSSQ